ncbi:hypothetical protein [Agromyces lapidis]|uniref:Uncharacterized protein n=1 Tax=Agromyces lapidis TaxID=279574 RepID=A0ABV5SMU3_9MICO|nr:hypothetical protein [Agromyces lapidis]
MADPVTIPTCMVCTIKAHGGDRFPEPLPDHVWMCPQHWNIYLALALGPMDLHLPTRVSVIAEPDTTTTNEDLIAEVRAHSKYLEDGTGLHYEAKMLTRLADALEAAAIRTAEPDTSEIDARE